MDATVIAAIIGAVAAIISAVIGFLATRAKEKANVELRRELARRGSGEKSIKHYLLFWWRGETDWGLRDWIGAQQYIAKFQPTCGFSRSEAANAEMVTIIGANSGIDEGAEQFLEAVGCRVERLDGRTHEDTLELLNRRIRSNKAFEGGLFRLGHWSQVKRKRRLSSLAGQLFCPMIGV